MGLQSYRVTDSDRDGSRSATNAPLWVETGLTATGRIWPRAHVATVVVIQYGR
jgi:hypothetical protein